MRKDIFNTPEDQLTPAELVRRNSLLEWFERLTILTEPNHPDYVKTRNYASRLPMFSNRHYNDNKDMDQQSQDYWDSLGA